MVSKKKKVSNANWDRDNMTAYTVKYRNDIYRLVEQAMEKSGMNRNLWTTTAIIEKLERDGFLKNESEK